MKQLLSILLLFLGFAASGQEIPCFKAYDQQGKEATVLCVGQQYKFDDCKGQVPDDQEYYIFDYKKGDAFGAATKEQTHTYTKPGSYRVLQIANYGGATQTDTVSTVYQVKDSPTPTFTAQSCANGLVTITITDTYYSSYRLDFGDGQQSAGLKAGSTTQHKYAAQGKYTVTVSGEFEGGACIGRNTKEVTTLPAPTTPFIRTLTVQEQATVGQLQLALENLQPGLGYLVQRWLPSTSNFETVDTLRNVTQSAISYQLKNTNTASPLTYRLRPFDVCGSPLQASNIVSSIALEASTTAETVQLTWQGMPHAQTYVLYKNGVQYRTLASNVKEFTDPEVVCGQTYQYQVQGVATDGSVSVSVQREIGVVSKSIPAVPYLFSTYTLSNTVELRLDLPEGEKSQEVYFEYSTSGGRYTKLAQATEPEYIHTVGKPTPRCYRATFTNACGNTSPFSNVACPVFLTAKKQADGTAVQLDWTSYEGFPGGVRTYTVELLDQANNIVNSYTATGNTYTDRSLPEDQPQFRYRVKASAPDGTASYSNLVVVEQGILLYIPNAFTPNGDGLNDTFVIKGRFYTSYRLLVYNAQGNVVYDGTEADAAWDGRYQGKMQPAGAYGYKVIAASDSGVTRQVTGTVTLLR